MLDEVIKRLEDIEINDLSFEDLKVYVEIIILIDKYKSSKDLMKTIDEMSILDY